MDQVEFDKLILDGMPTFIARRYKALLETTSARDRIQIITKIYDLWLRLLAIVLVSQYLIHDRATVSDNDLNRLLKDGFKRLTIDGWQDIFFTTLKVYKHKRNLFFIPELYDFFWDTSGEEHKPRPDVQAPFTKLTNASLEITQGQNSLFASGEEESAKELEDHLRRILQATAFFSSYELIRVLESHQGSFRLELYRGMHVITTGEALSGATSLKNDRFYLRARSQDFLDLHPLLIFWDKEAVESKSIPSEVAVYHRFLAQQLQYLLANSDKIVLDHDYFMGLINYVMGTIKDVKEQIVKANQLTWRQLGEISAEITKQRMATAQGKYSEELYLQRQKTLKELLKFIDSPQRCFVLIGRSGVGKTNFLFSFHHYLLHTRPDDVCMLMYDGALLHLDTPLHSTIKEDFDNRLHIEGKKIEDIWQEIAQIPNMTDPQRRVILCVDAINESARATELLRQLDGLVAKAAAAGWPWLKVIFSSRPETWQAIRGREKLAEAEYYRAERSDSVENLLEPFITHAEQSGRFEYSEQMDRFETDELEGAYAKYKAAFKLTTDYSDISFAVREVMREPLNLLLVARTYAAKGGIIPNRVRITDLVSKYMDSLLESGTLEKEDVRLLERQLIPLMVSLEHYDNNIPESSIDAAGGGLYEAIYSKREVVNRPFVKLGDAGILTHQKTEGAGGTELSIAFKYERFYEYFIGKRLVELSATQANRGAFFQNLIERTSENPFLWGAIRNALFQRLGTGDTQTITALCRSDHQRVKEMMIDTLTSYGADYPEKVELLLRQFTPVAEKVSSFRQLLQFTRRSGKAPDKGTQNAGKIAAEVASNLGFVEILQRAGLQSDPVMRAETARFGFLLWKRDQKAGFAVLDYLGQMTVRNFIPNLAAFESALGLTFLIIFDNQESDVIQHLQQLWHMVIGRILGINESANRINKVLRSFIRESLFSFAIGLAFLWINQLPENLPIRDKSFEAFFHRSATEKALYRRLTSYINPEGISEGTYTYEEMKRDFLAALPIMDGILQPVSCIGLSVHLARNPAVALPLMQELFDAAEKAPPPNLWLTGITFAVTPVLDSNPENDEVFEFFVQLMKRCQSYYALPGHSAAWIDKESPEAIFLGQYIYYEFKRQKTVANEWLKSKIEKALKQENDKTLKQENEKFFQLLVTIHLPLVVFEMEAPTPVFETLALFFKRLFDQGEQKSQIEHGLATQIKGHISTLLGQMRTRYPDAVDAFLEEQQAPPEFRLQVFTSESPEKVADLVGLRLFRVAFSLLAFKQPALRDKVIGLFLQAAECKNLRAMIKYLIREVINVIYQGEALRQAK